MRHYGDAAKKLRYFVRERQSFFAVRQRVHVAKNPCSATEIEEIAPDILKCGPDSPKR